MSESSDHGAAIEGVAEALPNPSPPSPVTEQAKPAEHLKAPLRPSVQSRKSSSSSMNGPLYMQTSNNKVFVRRVKRKGDGTLKSLARWFLENQAGMHNYTSFLPFWELPHHRRRPGGIATVPCLCAVWRWDSSNQCAHS